MPLPSRLLFSLLFALPACAAAQTAVVQTGEVRAELVAHAPQGLAPDRPAWLGLLIRHQPHWHTYWKNPGDSGLPTRLEWSLPAAWSAGTIDWPTPLRLPVGPLVNYGYEGELLLPVPLTVGAPVGAGAVEVRLRAEWLVCKEVCIPQSGEFALALPGAASVVSHAAAFERAFDARPKLDAAVRARSHVEGDRLALDVQGLPAAWHGRELLFFAADAGVIDHAARPVQQWDGVRLGLRVPLSAQRSESPAAMEAVLAAVGSPASVLLRFDVQGGWPPLGTAPSGGAAPSAPQASPAPAPASWLITLALAFVGGALLNLMPCVFPVLSLKVLGFAAHAADRRALAVGAMAYSAGVVLSFLLLAAALLVFRYAGAQVGWGFQLQSPVVVAALALLFLLLGLNLLGAFEFGAVLPAGWAERRARHPLVDQMLTGVLAVAVASPCTAPFMGAALGVALTQPPLEALLAFAALGAGMAAPYLALSLWPGLARRLPRPGAWMVTFRRVLALPMFATVVWLVWVLTQQLGTPPAPVAGERWQAWSSDAVAQARASGQPVFVDFTAAWCVTCQVNKRATLESVEVLAEFDAKQVRLLRADWTRRDDRITEELARLGRSGVPVYALYAPGDATPRLLSEILTVAEVRNALGRLAAPPHN